MDPRTRRAASTCTRQRLPRARGDGPSDGTCVVRIERAPPRSRGWTPAAQLRRGPERGSRALAGMDPTTAPAPPAARWLPRALAGMDPPSPSSARGRGGLPRARGDGPEIRRDLKRVCAARPRSRGWTLTSTLIQTANRGSPRSRGWTKGRVHSRRGSRPPRVRPPHQESYATPPTPAPARRCCPRASRRPRRPRCRRPRAASRAPASAPRPARPRARSCSPSAARGS